MGILDAVASSRAKEKGQDFGKMRLFAPAGWFIGSVCLGYYLDLSGKEWNDIAVIVAIVVSFGFMFLNSYNISYSFSINMRDANSSIELAVSFVVALTILFT